MEETQAFEREHIPGTLILLVLSIVFVIGSFLWGGNTFMPLVKSFEARSWQAGQAVVQSHMVREVERRQYVVEARYDYSWDGQDFTSERIFFDEMFGVRKRYYQNINRELSDHKDDRNPIRIWINPKQPQEAVIYRHVRWDKFAGNLLLFAIWMLITIGLCTASVLTLRDAAVQVMNRREMP